jgi:hypothetical protein
VAQLHDLGLFENEDYPSIIAFEVSFFHDFAGAYL